MFSSLSLVRGTTPGCLLAGRSTTMRQLENRNAYITEGAYLGPGYKWSMISTVCPRSSDPIYVVTYYIKWVTTSWTYSMKLDLAVDQDYCVSEKSCPFVYSEYTMRTGQDLLDTLIILAELNS